MPNKRNRIYPGSWAARYAAQRQLTNLRLDGFYDPVLQQNQADILRESRRADYHMQLLEAERIAAEEERKLFLEDPEGYWDYKKDQKYLSEMEEAEKFYDSWGKYLDKHPFLKGLLSTDHRGTYNYDNVDTEKQKETARTGIFIANYGKDFWNDTGRQMNDLQIGTF